MHTPREGARGCDYGYRIGQQDEGRPVGGGACLSDQFPRGFPGSKVRVESRQTAAEATWQASTNTLDG